MSRIADTSARFDWVFETATEILAVDDDPIQREFCSVYLAAPGVTVTTAENAEEALSLLAERRFDAALFDVDMPGMDGIELVAHGFMCKPVNWRLLAHQIKFMIRAHRAIRRAGET